MRVKAAAVPAYSPSTNTQSKTTSSRTKEQIVLPDSVLTPGKDQELDGLEYPGGVNKLLSPREQIALDLLFGPSEDSGPIVLNQLQIGLLTDIKA